MKFSVVNIGTATGAAGATLSITVGAAGVPKNCAIFVAVTEKSTTGVAGTLTDTAGNFSTTSPTNSGSLAATAVDGVGMTWQVNNAAALVNGNTITYNRNTSASVCAISAFYVTGQTPAATFTRGVANATGTTGTITVTSGSLTVGDLALGFLLDSGTSTAGGNATFTQAAGGWATPAIEANSGGSGNARVNGGNLLVAASGTKVYNPTLSSTAQQWILFVFGVIPAPDAAVTLDLPARQPLSINDSRTSTTQNLLQTLFRSSVLTPPPGKAVFDLPTRLPISANDSRTSTVNLLETTIAPIYIFRAPIFVDPKRPQKAGGEVSGTLNPVLTPNPPQPFSQDLWESATRAFPKVVGEAVGTLSPVLTPNPSRPFFQTIWDSAIPGKPKAYADPVAAISALYAPNPTHPFNQNLWEGAARAFPKLVSEVIGTLSPLLTPNPSRPFFQTIWDSAIPGTRAAKVDDFVNLLPFRTVVVVQPPFSQSDWLNAKPQSVKITDTSIAGLAPLLTPNPAQPFSQSSWDSATRGFPKAGGDVAGTLSPLLTPNPAQPFSQTDWLRISTVQKAKVDDVGDRLPFQTIVVVQPPFSQNDWLNAKPQPVKITDTSFAASDPLYYTPNPSQPFKQSLWDSASRVLAKTTGEAVGTLLSLFVPPVQVNYIFRAPIFSQIAPPQKAKVDDVANLLPLQPIVIYMPLPVTWPSPAEPVPSAKVDDVVNLALTQAIIHPPFNQGDWPNTARGPAAQKSDAYRGPNPVITPNPTRPFVPSDWTRIPKPATAKVDDVINIALLHAIFHNPFHQDEWISAARTALSLKSDVYAAPRTLIAPNPAQPFSQHDWDLPIPPLPDSDRDFLLLYNYSAFPQPVPPPVIMRGHIPHWRFLGGLTSSQQGQFYVTEDGTLAYVTEDGKTVYIKEP